MQFNSRISSRSLSSEKKQQHDLDYKTLTLAVVQLHQRSDGWRSRLIVQRGAGKVVVDVNIELNAAKHT